MFVAAIASVTANVKDGEEAIDYLRGEAPFNDREKFPLPYLMLLDLKMPRRNGFEVIAWVRQQPGLKRLPIVLDASYRLEALPDRSIV